MTDSGIGERMVLPIQGMHCADCALNIQHSLAHVPGVLSADVDYVMETATIHFDPYRVEPQVIEKAVSKPGYVIRDSHITRARRFWLDYRLAFFTITCGLLTIAAWALYIAGVNRASNIISIIGLVIGGYPLLRSAVLALRIPDLNADTLVVIAASAAAAIGAYQEAITVVFIMLLGEWLENLAVKRARKSLTSLIRLEPEQARLRTAEGLQEVPVGTLRSGDVVVVKPGERVPVDGEVVEGTGAMDTSTITGESLPVDVGPGDKVFAGTLLTGGSIDVGVLRVGEDTQLAQVKRLILEAQEKKADLQRIVDRFARYFIPTVLLIALVVWLVTGIAARGITVLVVACPCALVLGTPATVVAALGYAARRGVLIKGGKYLEYMGKLDALFLDKTGTLTKGSPRVVAVHDFGGDGREQVLRYAASAEARSEHPIAAAVLERAEAEGIADISLPRDFEPLPGLGVSALVGESKVLVGKTDLVTDSGIEISGEQQRLVGGEEDEGRTVFLVAVDGRALGAISVADTLREEAPAAIRKLESMGIDRIAMLTGDSPRVARAVARDLGIEEVYPGMLPVDKVQEVGKAVEEGLVVSMVGDGVNDAPALARSNVGVAMGAAGSDVAVETADVALMSDDLMRIPFTIALSHRSRRVIYENIAFAIVFNTVMVLLSALGWLPMVWGAILHQVSSLGVILNSMRCRVKE